jgi:hypothetical protein
VTAPILTALLHGAAGSWDELAMLALSALIGVALAVMLGSKGKKKS